VVGVLIGLIPQFVSAQGNFKTAPALHCLWKAEGKGNVVYLLGSIHLLKADNYPLPAVIESAFTNSQVAVFEIDIDKAEDTDGQARMASKISLPEGDSLAQELPPKVYASLSSHIKETGLPIAAIEQFKPAIAVTTLEMMELAQLGVDPEFGVDKHFFKLAQQTGKRIVPLETADFQVDLLTGLSKAEQELMVEKSLEEIDDEKKLYTDMVTAWQNGNAAGLETMLNKMRTDAPAIFKKLVTDRSQSWMPQIDQLLHGPQNAIVIVGAGHLVGKDGVVELLRKKGVKVTQL
jgi:uncharacterized protein YbaP (TraB family)